MSGLQSTIGVYGELFRVLGIYRGVAKIFSGGTHNFPNAPARFASGSYDL